MSSSKRDLSVAKLKQMSIPRALELIQRHYGFGRMTAERFYDFLASGQYKKATKPRSPRKVSKKRVVRKAA